MRTDERTLFLVLIKGEAAGIMDDYYSYFKRLEEVTGMSLSLIVAFLEKWNKKGFWEYESYILSGHFNLDKLSGEYREIYDEMYVRDILRGNFIEPELEKNESHGFDYTPISWADFLIIRNAAKIAANNIGYPVYLVGSALSKPNPRDIDISVIIPLRVYLKMFGPLPKRQEDFDKYLADAFYKTFEDLEALHTCLIETHHLDIKVCPDVWCKDKDKMLLASPNINIEI